MHIRAIETRYKGYRFRSRLEARWAVFFGHIGWPWGYEPEGFELPDGTRYLPDFKIGSVWIEVKATPPTPDELRKAWLLAQGPWAAVVFAVGLPDPQAVAGGLPGFLEGVPYERGLLDCVASPSSYCFHKWGYLGLHMGGSTPDPEDVAACNAARSARFEHGESGPRGGRRA